MKKLLFFLLAVTCLPTKGASISWDFENESGIASAVPNGITVSSLTVHNSWGVIANPYLSSSPSNYPEASGGINLGSPIKIGAFDLDSSTYISFTLTPDIEVAFTLESISFGIRSTSTGPQAFSFRWSHDAFASDLANGEIINDAAWGFHFADIPGVAVTDGFPVEFRLYFSEGQGTAISNVANHRLDDLSLGVSVHAVPEPAAAVIVIASAGIGGLLHLAGCGRK